ncbi:MAG: hypothetical protein WC700_14555 [Gemmatimonadaceae bacterium]|jgi:hypothetical protein
MPVTTKEEASYEYVYCASGFTQYKPYVLDLDSTAHGYINAAPATLAVGQRVGVPQGTTTTVAGWYPFCVKGACIALVDGTSNVADGGWIELINAGVAFITDSDTTRSANSVGIVLEAQATDAATATHVFLTGDPVQIAGS